MKIIHRYVFREFAESSLFGLLVFSSILLLDQIFQFFNLIIKQGIGFIPVLKLFVLVVPNIFSLTIPMAVLFGILMSYGRLSEDNEITAFRSSGMNYGSFTYIILAFAGLLCLFLLYFNQYLSPYTQRKFRETYQEVVKQKPLIKFDEKSITKVGEYKIYVNRIDKKNSVINGISIYKFPNSENDLPWRITAASASVCLYPDSVMLLLHNGYWQRANPAKPDNLIHLTFSNYYFPIIIGEHQVPVSQSLREMSGKDLISEIKNYRQKSVPTQFLETEYWLRWMLAFAPFVFTLAGIPVAIVLHKGGKSMGFGISLILLFCFYILLVVSLNLSEKGYAPPGLIMWMPDIAMLVFGIFAWKKMAGK